MGPLRRGRAAASLPDLFAAGLVEVEQGRLLEGRAGQKQQVAFTLVQEVGDVGCQIASPHL